MKRFQGCNTFTRAYYDYEKKALTYWFDRTTRQPVNTIEATMANERSV